MKISSSTTNQSFFAYKQDKIGYSLCTIWQNEARPADIYEPKKAILTIENGNFNTPVFVYLVMGKIYEIPKVQWEKTGN